MNDFLPAKYCDTEGCRVKVNGADLCNKCTLDQLRQQLKDKTEECEELNETARLQHISMVSAEKRGHDKAIEWNAERSKLLSQTQDSLDKALADLSKRDKVVEAAEHVRKWHQISPRHAITQYSGEGYCVCGICEAVKDSKEVTP